VCEFDRQLRVGEIKTADVAEGLVAFNDWQTGRSALRDGQAAGPALAANEEQGTLA